MWMLEMSGHRVFEEQSVIEKEKKDDDRLFPSCPVVYIYDWRYLLSLALKYCVKL